MAERFQRGGVAYAKDGRKYRVDDVEGGVVYCSSDAGAETEFSSDQLLTQTEWEARGKGDRDRLYGRLKLSDAYAKPGPRLDKGAGEKVIAVIGRLVPGFIDFAAYRVAVDFVTQAGETALVSGLSVAKCRQVFDGAPLEVRVGVLARTLGVPPKTLIDAAQIGDNLMRAILSKGMEAYPESLAEFRARR